MKHQLIPEQSPEYMESKFKKHLDEFLKHNGTNEDLTPFVNCLVSIHNEISLCQTMVHMFGYELRKGSDYMNHLKFLGHILDNLENCTENLESRLDTFNRRLKAAQQ